MARCFSTMNDLINFWKCLFPMWVAARKHYLEKNMQYHLQRYWFSFMMWCDSCILWAGISDLAPSGQCSTATSNIWESHAFTSYKTVTSSHQKLIPLSVFHFRTDNASVDAFMRQQEVCLPSQYPLNSKKKWTRIHKKHTVTSGRRKICPSHNFHR